MIDITNAVLEHRCDFAGQESTYALISAKDRQILLSTSLHKLQMNLPAPAEEDMRVELALEIPTDYPATQIPALLPSLDGAAEILRAGGWLGYGHTLPAPKLSPFTRLFLLPLKKETGEDYVIPSGNLVITIYRAIPLYPDEVEMLANTDGAFLEKRSAFVKDFGLFGRREHLTSK